MYISIVCVILFCSLWPSFRFFYCYFWRNTFCRQQSNMKQNQNMGSTANGDRIRSLIKLTISHELSMLPKPSIFRVPTNLYRLNPKAYILNAFSFGLFIMKNQTWNLQKKSKLGICEALSLGHPLRTQSYENSSDPSRLWREKLVNVTQGRSITPQMNLFKFW